MPALISDPCSFPLWYGEREDSPMYLWGVPSVLQDQHSITYPTPSTVHFGILVTSSLAGLGLGGWPGRVNFLSSSSLAYIYNLHIILYYHEVPASCLDTLNSKSAHYFSFHSKIITCIFHDTLKSKQMENNPII